MNCIKIIINKELKRVFSDKKLIFSLFILPAIIVIGMYSLIGVMADKVSSDIDSHISFVTIVNATDDMKSIINNGEFSKCAEITYLSEDEYERDKEAIRESVREEQTDLLVYLDPQFEGKIANYSQAGDAIPVVKLGYNQTSNYSGAAYSSYSSMVAQPYRDQLLAKRFGNLDLLNIFTTEEENIVKEAKQNSQALAQLLPYFIVMMLFAGAMSVGIDAIAGEKERGTLATMLLSPAKRSDIVWGKLISLIILSGLSSIIYAGSMIIAAPLMTKSMGQDASLFGNVSFDAVQIVELFAIMLALSFLFVSVIGLLATYAKDVKTATSLSSPCYIIVIIAGMLTMFNSSADIAIQKYAIPVYGNALIIKDICANEVVIEKFGASLIGTLAIGVLCVIAMTRAFNNEKIMFNA